jgi:riboflavin kinase/FMN adenylyltransferase
MKLKNSIKSIAIGSFDGIHIAHQKLISQVEGVVVIERNLANITHSYRRVEYIQKPTFFYHFEHIRYLSAREFIARVVEDFPKLEKIVVGYDFAFGYKKEGETQLLKQLFGGEIVVLSEVKFRGLSIHSCVIREAILRGKLLFANRVLNRNYKLVGEVVRGQGLGSRELVPTLNLKVFNYVLPKGGVYVTITKIGSSKFSSVTFLGHRVSVDGTFAIETHILDKDIGEVQDSVEIEFVSFIRNNRKFSSLKALKAEIFKDIEFANSKLKLRI